MACSLPAVNSPIQLRFLGTTSRPFLITHRKIRAPEGTIAGVRASRSISGNKEIYTPGDMADVLVAMNPAALKSNLRWIKKSAIVIIDVDSLLQNVRGKAGFTTDRLPTASLDGFNVY
jgi:2-oxoglutarate ferredoxin oxidoreductase subunit alpha